MTTEYSQEFKESMLQKIFFNLDRSVVSFAREANIPGSTVATWVRSYKKKNGEIMGQKKACALLGITERTLQRWKQTPDNLKVIHKDIKEDQRQYSKTIPANKLLPEEKQAIIKICNNKDYMHIPPSQIIPALADQGVYLASESSFYRVLHEDGQQQHKGATMLATLQDLGVIPSSIRPSVSNDNPYSESLFKTLKYTPIYPSKPFDTMEISEIGI